MLQFFLPMPMMMSMMMVMVMLMPMMVPMMMIDSGLGYDVPGVVVLSNRMTAMKTKTT